MDSNEIWHISVDHGSTVCCQIWLGLVKGMGTRATQNVKIWSKLQYFGGVFAAHGRHNTLIQMNLSL